MGPICHWYKSEWFYCPLCQQLIWLSVSLITWHGGMKPRLWHLNFLWKCWFFSGNVFHRRKRSTCLQLMLSSNSKEPTQDDLRLLEDLSYHGVIRVKDIKHFHIQLHYFKLLNTFPLVMYFPLRFVFFHCLELWLSVTSLCYINLYWAVW